MTFPTVNYAQSCEDYRRIERAIIYLEKHFTDQPSLAQLAASAGLSEFHFQRVFTRWVGISPKRFMQYLTREHAKELLKRSADLLQATYASGLSSPGRLHDLFVTHEAVTPGEYKTGGQGLEVSFGFHPSPFGECLLAVTRRGICFLAFTPEGRRGSAPAELQRQWPRASLRQDEQATLPQVEQVFQFFSGEGASGLSLHLRGTNFQIKVWEALLRIPAGYVVTYADLAVQIGMPSASRAVGSAVGRNPLPVIIPCHRVIRKAGDFGNYRYGAARKKALLAWESARCVSKVDLSGHALQLERTGNEVRI
jgi:AraC family transcriptional regulator of adaptative response/methylated-DNA-[protein]-cysteine methyltransferase